MSVDAAVALISVAQVKEALKITGSAEDTVLEGLVNRASALAAKYCGRKLVSASYTEYYDGDETDELLLNNRPVTALTSVHDDVDRAFGSGTEVLAADRILDGAAGIVRLWNNGGVFTKGRSNVKVVYTAGYVAGSTVPYDLQDAVIMIVQHHYKRIYQDGRIGLQSETVGDRTFAYSADAIPAKAKEILNRYREQLQPGGGHV